MKKGTLAVALVVIFIIAMAGTAVASWMDSGYTSWSNEASAVAGTSPHYGYSATTKNCSVCHAVHRAAGGGQVLLKDTVANSCSFCHITVATTDSTKKVYGGSQYWYTTDIRGNHYDGPGALGVGCTECHAVHGAKTVANGSQILKLDDYYTGTYQSTPTIGGAATPTDLDQTKWCSGCHPYYNTNINGTSHVMKAGGQTYSAGAGRTYSGLVSSSATTYCISCHNGTGSGAGQNFPHYTPFQPRFLSTGATSSVNTNVVNNDAPCLGCHNGAGAQVGVNY